MKLYLRKAETLQQGKAMASRLAENGGRASSRAAKAESLTDNRRRQRPTLGTHIHHFSEQPARETGWLCKAFFEHPFAGRCPTLLSVRLSALGRANPTPTTMHNT
jgi:hypothetical protein